MQAPEGRRRITTVVMGLRSSLEHCKLRQETLAMLGGKNIGMLATYVRGKDNLRQGRGEGRGQSMGAIMLNEIVGHVECFVKEGTERLDLGVRSVGPRNVLILQQVRCVMERW